MWARSPEVAPPSIETLRKEARVLVIDDHVLPAQKTFERDGYHFERWSEIKNLSQLTDGHYHLILLDVHGVGLNESPDKQGLGILDHIKRTNPAQPVIVYSAQPQNISMSLYASLADAVLDKSATYVEYKDAVDRLLTRRASPGYFIAAMNTQLGDQAASAPKAVQYALRAMKTGNTERLGQYLAGNLPTRDQVDLIIRITSVGISAWGAFHK